MAISKEDFKKVEHLFPVPRKKPTLGNHETLDAMLFMAENGCKWRAMPKEFGNWHSLYTKITRWAKNGVLKRIFEFLRGEGFGELEMSIDSTIVKVHPHAAGALKKRGLNVLAAVAEDLHRNYIHCQQVNEQALPLR